MASFWCFCQDNVQCHRVDLMLFSTFCTTLHTPAAPCSHCLKQQPSHPAVYLLSLTPDPVPGCDTCILRHTTVSGSDGTLAAHSRLLPSLITRQPAISQQRLGITIQVHKTERPTRPWANTAIHLNKDVPSGNQRKMMKKKAW